MTDSLCGNLTWDSIMLVKAWKDPNVNNLITAGAAAMIPVGALMVPLLLLWTGWWRPLFRDWLASVDHKKIGVLYIALAVVMLFRGVVEGTLMRLHHATALHGGVLSPDHFNQLFTTHGTTMIFFVAMPLITGLMNVVIPLQLGARDVAYPRLNQIGFWLTASGGFLITISLLIGQFATGGWSAYPAYTGSIFSPGVGVDYWLLSVGLSGIGSTLSGVNFAVTLYKLRAPGMTFMRMPLFLWTSLCVSILLVLIMPPLTVACITLGLDRYLGFHFYTNDLGGNLMNFINLFWMFGHPEVYILALPAYGVMSEVASTFSAKRLYGYPSIVVATMCIAVLSFLVWLHHFFTMGQSALVNAVFGIATLIIAIPTGMKVYDWLATLWRGRIRFTTPMIYLCGFLVLFVIGGLTGIILANPTIDFQVHNSLFLVAHFHNVIIPGVVFGMLAGLHYWFPKVFGFRLLESWGRTTAWLWIVGFSVTFFPLYVAGLMGMRRRAVDYADPAIQPYMIVAAIGSLILCLAFLALLGTILRSILLRKQLAVPLGDPWDARTLEWATPCPPPEYNFAVLPEVTARDAFWEAKENGTAYAPVEKYEDIHLPPPTYYGLWIGAFASVLGFAVVWHIGWLSLLGLLGSIAVPIAYALLPYREIILPAAEVQKQDEAWRCAARETDGVTRDEEAHATNRGLAKPDELEIEFAAAER
ncbi:MAG: cbb3-type cytochrome c oxidase subunit I [Verrucomicrobiales bacterium]|nr:cbb3-type cytochrome c oxidase subunit I [Verrucomicrobiales bacterium]